MTLCRDLGMVDKRPMSLLLLSGAEINLSLLPEITVRALRSFNKLLGFEILKYAYLT